MNFFITPKKFLFSVFKQKIIENNKIFLRKKMKPSQDSSSILTKKICEENLRKIFCENIF